MKKYPFSMLPSVSFVCIALVFALAALTSCTMTPDFEKRADELIAQMTLEEKVGMMYDASPGVPRLGIPPHNFWNECLHGVARAGRATVFPQAIAMAATWDAAEMHAIADAIADEARAKHEDFAARGKRDRYMGLTYWTPNINIFRDPRWGRGMETYGEDPYLTASLAIPFVKGLQGDDSNYLKLVATVKHFAVHSGPESTRHRFDVEPSAYDLEETYLPHFRRTVQEARAYSVMCAYQRLYGLPCCGSEYLSNLLRHEWGFDGYIVSDCGAIADFYKKGYHEVVPTAEQAAAMAVKAGTDLNCGSTYRALTKAVEQKLITEAELDVSVRRMVIAMLKLGLIDGEKCPYRNVPYSVVESPEHVVLSLDVARKSMVLLKNEGTLPFAKTLKNVVVIGPNANDNNVLLANYHGFASEYITPWKGIAAKLPDAQVRYVQGCRLATNLPLMSPIATEFLFTDSLCTQHGLIGSYSLPDTTAITNRVDPNIDFIWSQKNPVENLAYNNFIVEWTGVLVPPITGKYAFGGDARKGMKIYLNDSLIVAPSLNGHDELRNGNRMVNLQKDVRYNIRVEYKSNTEYAYARLLWDIPRNDEELRNEALQAAADADAVVLCMGLSAQLEGEEMKVQVDGFAGGDRITLGMPKVQEDLIQAVMQLKKPTALVLLNGSALACNWAAENVPAILEAWYPGQQGGNAIADVLFGDYNPAGRLPITFYRSADDLPPFDDYNMQGKTYRYFSGTPLYEFGHGLSYTKFSYNIAAIPDTIKANENINLTVSVKNVDAMDGEEVVQLYVSLPQSKLQKPICALQGFSRIHLKAGEQRDVQFTLTPSQFSARDAENNAVVEAGVVRLSIGGSQPNDVAIAANQVVVHDVEVLKN